MANLTILDTTNMVFEDHIMCKFQLFRSLGYQDIACESRIFPKNAYFFKMKMTSCWKNVNISKSTCPRALKLHQQIEESISSKFQLLTRPKHLKITWPGWYLGLAAKVSPKTYWCRFLQKTLLKSRSKVRGQRLKFRVKVQRSGQVMETQVEPFWPCGWVFWIKFVDWVGQKMGKSKIGHSLRGEGVKVPYQNM